MTFYDSKKFSDSTTGDREGQAEGVSTYQTGSTKVVEIPITSESKNVGVIDPRFLDALNSISFENNQFTALKTKLLYPSSGKLRRSIAVTSPGMGEGKTYVVTNVALRMGQNVDHTQILLMDCDLGKPSIQKHFSLSGLPGLSDGLRGSMPIDSIVYGTKIDNLNLLLAGSHSENPSELLSSGKMSKTLSEIQTRYDDGFILIDLPSPNLVPEAGIVASHLDGVIIVVRYGQTTKKQLQELIDSIGKENVIGVVFNQFDSTSYSSIYRMYRKFIHQN